LNTGPSHSILMSAESTIGFIGGGNMATSLITGLLARGTSSRTVHRRGRDDRSHNASAWRRRSGCAPSRTPSRRPRSRTCSSSP
jgi:hypothetical protein